MLPYIPLRTLSRSYVHAHTCGPLCATYAAGAGAGARGSAGVPFLVGAADTRIAPAPRRVVGAERVVGAVG